MEKKAELILFKLLIPLGLAISLGMADNYIINAICVFIVARAIFQKVVLGEQPKGGERG